jgi:hypothetical protein
MFNETGGTIPAISIQTDYLLTVSGLTPATLYNTFGLEQVCADINYQLLEELTLYYSISGWEAVKLTDCMLQGDFGFTNTCFTMSTTNY